MGMQIRDDRQMKALTGLSQAHFDHLLPVFSAIYQTPPDLVVKFQPLDIVGVILRLALRPPAVYQREIKG